MLRTTTLSVEEAENKKVNFLVDTASSLSLVKPSVLEDDVQCHRLEEKFGIEGIGEGSYPCEFFVNLTLVNDVKHHFFVVSDDFPIEEEAVLGDDFFEQNKVVIDYKTKKLKFANRSFSFNEKVEMIFKMEPGNIAMESKDSKNECTSKGNFSSEHSESEEESTVDFDAKSSHSSSESNVDSNDDVESFSECTERNLHSSSDSNEDYDGNEESVVDWESESDSDDEVGSAISFDEEATCSSKGSNRDSDEEVESGDETEKISHISRVSDRESDTDEEVEVPKSKKDDESVVIFVPKQAGVYASVRVNKCGVGIIPQLEFDDEVFSISSVVNTCDDVVKIPILNTTDEDVRVEIPVLNAKPWDEEWDKLDDPQKKIKFCNLCPEKRTERLLSSMDFSHLNFEEKNLLVKLIKEFDDVFYVEGDQPESNEAFEHEIKLKEMVKPINLRQFRIPFALKGEMERNIKEMLDADLIEESCSPWNLPSFLVKKKLDRNGIQKFRLVTDMRKLNENIVQDVFPLPIIDEVLGRLGDARYFSVLDLWKGFYQIGLKK